MTPRDSAIACSQVEAALPAQPPAALLIGFSGGLDSSVLLHAAAQRPAYRRAGLRAIHVHHGLQADADAWATHCARICAALAVPLHVVHVQIAHDSGDGLEAAARQARRTAFAQWLATDEWLALAQHRDDQAETFLLRALRASGPDGLAAIRPQRPFASSMLWRPLLALPRADLLAYAQAHGLQWIEDPSNTDARHDRNFLRNHVLPLLQQRWPHAGATLARSAQLCGEASALLQDDDAALLSTVVTPDGALDLARLRAQPALRRARLLRAWVDATGAPPLPARGVAALEREIDAIASDRKACFRWRQWEVRRWRQHLHLQRPPAPWPAHWQSTWDGCAPLALPDGTHLELVGAASLRFDPPLQVRARHGGERIVLPGRSHSHLLKHVLQTLDLPPWQRTRLPILWRDARVLAAGDRLLSAELTQWLDAHQARLQWRPSVPTN
ncbi:tRNA lysidine(34) synthetase TilS [Xanthomonas maliensis]|uniref:tRNA lysidine(34) synthetase TilS n=1 Tax=Xanthomonas maliensis TaxID=1321368 RepID=UPI0003B79703|nr:tRNA lysidine(34) synthetase TilS [Xanthomonas maliensis]KAB7770067.1 tRNA(Ile)-lysidine synthetase [Xanthomonas maliensis]